MISRDDGEERIDLKNLERLTVLPIRITEPWCKFSRFTLPIPPERLWILTNLVHAIGDVLSGTNVSKVKISINLDDLSMALALYDENGRRIYFDFIGSTFPEKLLEEVGFNKEEVVTIRNKWKVISEKLKSQQLLLVLQPLLPVDINTVREIVRMIKDRFKNFTIILKEPIKMPEKFLDSGRGQIRADLALNWLKSIKNSRGFLLGITDHDLYIPNYNFVFNVQDKYTFSKVSIFSLRRLRQSFYNLPENRQLFLERVRKQVYHIIGHFLGLSDCPNKFCVMSYSNSILELDAKSTEFCPRCEGLLKPGRLILHQNTNQNHG